MSRPGAPAAPADLADRAPLRVIYSQAHPSDRLVDERAGHIVRAVQLLAALERAGHEVTRVEAAEAPATALGARAYHSVLGRALGPGLGTTLRDLGRVAGNWRFGRRLRHVAQDRPVDVVMETHVGFSRAGARVATARRRPLVLDDVSPAAEDEEVYDVRLRGLARAARRFTLTRTTLATAVSAPLRDLLVDGDGLDSRRVLLLPNGVHPEMLQHRTDARARRAELAGQADLLIAFAGSFQRFHRVDLLLTALASCRARDRLRLVLVGDGDEWEGSQRLARDLGVEDRATFVGRVPSLDVQAFLQAADACVLPATEPYMDPMKVYEYLAAGRPIVVPDMASVRAILGAHPVMVEFAPEDPVALSRALDTLVRMGGDNRARMGQAAHALAHRHTWDARAATLVEALRAVPPLNAATALRPLAWAPGDHPGG